MSVDLVADFTKTYSRGASVTAALSMPGEGFACTVLFGPSGGGKSTILRCLAGLERPETGRIAFGDEAWFDAQAGICLPPQRRGIGLLFQDGALFPHLTVAQNIGYGVNRAERSRRVAELLERFGLHGLGERRPRELSGGQQQRVALARAVATHPRLLLLDEPLSALDTQTRAEVRRELRAILKVIGVPVIVVTHDSLEAMALGDDLVIVDAGRVRQAGKVEGVFGRPNDMDVARIVGVESILPGTIAVADDGMLEIDVPGSRVVAVGSGSVGDRVHVCIRAADVVLQGGAPGSTTARNRWAARVTAITPEGPTVRVEMHCGFRLTAVITTQACADLALAEGVMVTALVKATGIHVVPRG